MTSELVAVFFEGNKTIAAGRTALKYDVRWTGDHHIVDYLRRSCARVENRGGENYCRVRGIGTRRRSCRGDETAIRSTLLRKIPDDHELTVMDENCF